jgi:hypothetical protein
MRVDRPLIGAILFLGGGLAVIIGYCHGATAFGAAYPFTQSMLHIELTTTGPGVVGGLALMAIGALFLVWAFLAAIVSLFTWEESPRAGRERFSGRYSVVPVDEDDDLPAEAETRTDDQEHVWSRPQTRGQI